MAEKSMVSPDDQTVTFVELFFDLVFVFSITQVVTVLAHHLTWTEAGASVLVFWLIWWAWTQFTWSLNAANTDHNHVQIATLTATAIAFFMAVSVPSAFGDGALWFAVPYVLVRLVGLFVYRKVTMENPEQAAAVRLFSMASIGGFAAVLIGAVLGAEAQYWLWGLAILLDVLAANVASTSDDWGIHHEHFVERHGLIVIIALGESLIVAASGLVGAEITFELLVVGLFAVLVTCALWWSYFPYVRPLLEHHLSKVTASAQSTMARDAFSLGHFPLLCGIIGIAVAVEVAVAHPGQSMTMDARIAMAVGLLLFTIAAVYAQWRTANVFPILRLGVIVVTGVVVLLLSGIPAWGTIAVAFVGIAGVVIVEHIHCRPLIDAILDQNTGPE